MSKVKRIVKYIFTKKRILFPLILLFGFIFAYQFDLTYKIYKEQINTRTVNYLGFDGLKITNEIAHKLDFIGSIKGAKNPVSDTDKVTLLYSDSVQLKLDKYLTKTPVKKKWVKGQIVLEGITYDIKFKFHGTSTLHYYDGKYSYSIKLSKNGKYYKNSRRYKLIKGEEANPTLMFANYMANKKGLISPHGRMVELKVNGEEEGHYYLVEDIKSNYLEREFGISNHTTLSQKNDWNSKSKIYNHFAHSTDLDLEAAHLDTENEMVDRIAVQSYKNVCEHLKNGEIEEMSTYFDQEYLGRFMALAQLFNDNHFLTGDNLKYVYNLSNNKFYPIFRSENGWRKMNNHVVASKGRAINTFPDFNSILFESFPLYTGSETHEILKGLLSNNRIRNERDLCLQEILSNKTAFLSDLDDMFEENKAVMLNSSASRRAYNFNRKEMKVLVNNTLSLSEKYLKYNLIFGTLDPEKKSLSIINDGYCPIDLIEKSSGKKIQRLKGIQFDVNLDFTNYKNEFHFEDSIFYKDKYVFINSITKDTIRKKNISINYINSISNDTSKDFLSKINESGIRYHITDDTLTLEKGVYSIEKSILIPKKYTVIIEAGLNLKINQHCFFMAQGDMDVNGTESNPVIIFGDSLKNFRTFGLYSKNRKANFKASHLIVKFGGHESVISNTFFSGALCVYNANVTMDHCTVMKSMGDDGLNLKHCNVQLNSCSFKGNKADQVDLDFCKALVENCYFEASIEDPNGDGLDLSGSKFIVKSCRFLKFKDKGISCGENSKGCVTLSEFTNNVSGITLKDQADVYSYKNIFNTNNYDYSLYIKKKIFSSPTLHSVEKINKINLIDGQTNSLEIKVFNEKLKWYQQVVSFN